MMARRWVPSPTFLSSSCATTLKRSLRPSTSVSSAVTVTFLPFGVAAKCLTCTSKPTVVWPSGRCACTASMPARSIRPIMLGVDSTPSPPMCLTTRLSSTVLTISALSPGVSGMSLSPLFGTEASLGDGDALVDRGRLGVEGGDQPEGALARPVGRPGMVLCAGRLQSIVNVCRQDNEDFVGVDPVQELDALERRQP